MVAHNKPCVIVAGAYIRDVPMHGMHPTDLSPLHGLLSERPLNTARIAWVSQEGLWRVLLFPSVLEIPIPYEH